MTKKDRYFKLREAGHSHQGAASRANLSSRQVRYRYGREYQDFRKSAAESQAPSDPEEQLFYSLPPAARAAYLALRGDRPPLQEWIAAGKLEALQEPRTASIIPPAQDYPLEPSQTRLEANSTKKAQADFTV